MMENRGKLLVSTKTSAGIKIFQLVSCIFSLILFLFFAFNFQLFRRMGADILGNATFGTILWFVMIMLFLLEPIICIMGNRSYCDIYENSIIGVTALSFSHPNTPMQKFDITYNEIINVTESGKTLCIYTAYATYEVLAMTNRPEAIKEIRARMSGNSH